MTDFNYPLTVLGVLVVLLIYAYSTRMVGRMRGKHGVKVPETTGPGEFVRAYRAQMNMLEFLPIFLPLAAVFAYAFGDLAGFGYTILFAIGRYLYFRGYIRAPEARMTGFAIATLSTLSVLIACLAAVLWQLAAPLFG
ncbi:MAG: MAPEG family protein [Pseudomonadota bacterium]